MKEQDVKDTQTSYSIYAFNNRHKQIQARADSKTAEAQTSEEPKRENGPTKTSRQDTRQAPKKSYFYDYELSPDVSEESLTQLDASELQAVADENVDHKKRMETGLDEQYFKFMAMATQMAFSKFVYFLTGL